MFIYMTYHVLFILISHILMADVWREKTEKSD